MLDYFSYSNPNILANQRPGMVLDEIKQLVATHLVVSHPAHYSRKIRNLERPRIALNIVEQACL
jgi:hypothetical protein